MGMTFQRAQKSASYLRMGLSGPSGSGKTMTALILASALADGKGVAVIDTERGSASKYSDLFTFDVVELDSYHPDLYIEAIKAAESAGYGALVIDSLSHAWNATGGLLEQHEQAVRRQQTKNSYTAWAEITPIQNRLINAITSAKIHVIATMRSKVEYTIGDDKKVRKVGMAPIQREGMEYEFDVFAEMDQDNTLIVQKSRCTSLSGAVINKPTGAVAVTLADWLHGDGSAPTVPVPAAATAKLPPERVESIEANAWAQLQKRAETLGFDEGMFQNARSHYKTVAAVAARLDKVEKDRSASVLGELLDKARKLGYSSAQWKQLRDDCRDDPKIIEQALASAEETDLRQVAANTPGVH